LKEPTREQLLEENRVLRTENSQFRVENAKLKQRVEELEKKLDQLIRKMFGRSSEKLTSSQLELIMESAKESELGKEEASSLKEADPAKPTKAKSIKRGRASWPADLPIVEEVKQTPEAWRYIGSEISEQLDLRARTLFSTADHTSQIHQARSSGSYSGNRPDDTSLAGTGSGCSWSFSNHHRRKIRGPSSALPPGSHI